MRLVYSCTPCTHGMSAEWSCTHNRYSCKRKPRWNYSVHGVQCRYIPRRILLTCIFRRSVEIYGADRTVTGFVRDRFVATHGRRPHGSWNVRLLFCFHASKRSFHVVPPRTKRLRYYLLRSAVGSARERFFS